MDEYEAIVVGGGAAGLSAGLILGRSRRRVLVCDDDRPRNAPSGAVHGFLSREGIDPRELLRIGREDVTRYPTVEFYAEHVASVRREKDGFIVEAGGNAFRCSKLLLATGMYDQLPRIDGLARIWGRGAFVCPYCDAWEFRGKRIAAIGTTARANELAEVLRQWSDDVTVCDQSSVERVEGDDRPEIVLAGGKRIACDAIFLSAPLRVRHPLIDALGIRLREDGEIDADDCGRTSVPHCYAAGDAVTTVHQLAFAAASGVRAAMTINEDFLDDQKTGAITAGDDG